MLVFSYNLTKMPWLVGHQKSGSNNAQKMRFFIKDFLSKCDQIRRKLKKSLMENFIFAQYKNNEDKKNPDPCDIIVQLKMQISCLVVIKFKKSAMHMEMEVIWALFLSATIVLRR